MVDALALDGDVRGPRGCVLPPLEEGMDIELCVGATVRTGPERGIPTFPAVWRATSSLPPAAVTAREVATEAYKPELDAAMTGGDVAVSMTIRQEVIHTATFPLSLRTTWPAARRKMGWLLPCFEGQSMTISR